MMARPTIIIALLFSLVAPSFAVLPFAPLIGELIVAGRVGTALAPRVLPRVGVQAGDPTVQAALVGIGMAVAMSNFPSKLPSVSDRVQMAKDTPLPSLGSDEAPGIVKKYQGANGQFFSSAFAAANSRMDLYISQMGGQCPTGSSSLDAIYCPTSVTITHDTYSNNAIFYKFNTNATNFTNQIGSGNVSCSDGSAVDWTNPLSPVCKFVPPPEQPNGKCDVQISAVAGAYVLNRRASDPDCSTDTGTVISPDGKTISQAGVDAQGNPVSIQTKVNPDGGTSTSVSTQTSTSTASGNSTSVETTNITTNAAGDVISYNTTVNNNSSITNINGTVVNNTPTQPINATVNVDLPTDYARENTLSDVKTNTKNIEDTLKGQGVNSGEITAVRTDQLDDVYQSFNSKILEKIQNPVGSAMGFSFGFPISSTCMPLPWAVHGFAGSWDYCPQWDSTGRPALAFLFYALTGFFIYDVFASSGRGK